MTDQPTAADLIDLAEYSKLLPELKPLRGELSASKAAYIQTAALLSIASSLEQLVDGFAHPIRHAEPVGPDFFEEFIEKRRASSVVEGADLSASAEMIADEQLAEAEDEAAGREPLSSVIADLGRVGGEAYEAERLELAKLEIADPLLDGEPTTPKPKKKGKGKKPKLADVLAAKLAEHDADEAKKDALLDGARSEFLDGVDEDDDDDVVRSGEEHDADGEDFPIR